MKYIIKLYARACRVLKHLWFGGRQEQSRCRCRNPVRYNLMSLSQQSQNIWWLYYLPLKSYCKKTGAPKKSPPPPIPLGLTFNVVKDIYPACDCPVNDEVNGTWYTHLGCGENPDQLR